ncbi:MAG: hypothetical protein H6702_19065 [Myxococcales bacterium]|nr:hypothetical protein [Myxococcales bacterium]
MERRDRSAFFLGFAIALLVAVPVSLLGMRTLADNVTGLLMAAVGALLGVGLLGTLLFLFRRQLFRGTLGSLPAVYAPIPELVAHLKAGDQAAAAEAATLVGQRFVAWWGGSASATGSSEP